MTIPAVWPPLRPEPPDVPVEFENPVVPAKVVALVANELVEVTPPETAPPEVAPAEVAPAEVAPAVALAAAVV